MAKHDPTQSPLPRTPRFLEFERSHTAVPAMFPPLGGGSGGGRSSGSSQDEAHPEQAPGAPLEPSVDPRAGRETPSEHDSARADGPPLEEDGEPAGAEAASGDPQAKSGPDAPTPAGPATEAADTRGEDENGTAPAESGAAPTERPEAQPPEAARNDHLRPVPEAPESGGLTRVEEALARLREANARLAEEARNDALEIGFLVARRILEREVSANVEAVLDLIRGAVRRAADSRVIRVRLNPRDHDAVDRVDPKARAAAGVAEVELAPDEDLGPGDVVVETEFGHVNGRLDARLQALRHAVLRSLGGQE